MPYITYLGIFYIYIYIERERERLRAHIRHHFLAFVYELSFWASEEKMTVRWPGLSLIIYCDMWLPDPNQILNEVWSFRKHCIGSDSGIILFHADTGCSRVRKSCDYTISGGCPWRHDMDKLSIFLAPCEGNRSLTGGFVSQRASDAKLWCFSLLAWTRQWTNTRVAGHLIHILTPMWPHYDKNSNRNFRLWKLYSYR